MSTSSPSCLEWLDCELASLVDNFVIYFGFAFGFYFWLAFGFAFGLYVGLAFEFDFVFNFGWSELVVLETVDEVHRVRTLFVVKPATVQVSRLSFSSLAASTV